MVRPPLQRLRNRRKKQAQIVMLTGHALGGVTEYRLDDVGPFAVVAQPRRDASAVIVRRGRLITREATYLHNRAIA